MRGTCRPGEQNWDYVNDRPVQSLEDSGRRLRRGSCRRFRSPRRPPLGRAASVLQELERFRRLCRRQSARAAVRGRADRTPAGVPARPASAVSQTTKPNSRSRRRFVSRRTAPPPVATIARRDICSGQFGEGPLFPVAEDGLALFGKDRAQPTGRRVPRARDRHVEKGPTRRGRPESALPSTCRSHDSRRAPIPDPAFETTAARGRVSFLAER